MCFYFLNLLDLYMCNILINACVLPNSMEKFQIKMHDLSVIQCQVRDYYRQLSRHNKCEKNLEIEVINLKKNLKYNSEFENDYY
jgi:putative hemolysin